MPGPQPVVRVEEHNGDATIDVYAVDERGCLRGAVHGLAQLAGAPDAPPGDGRSWTVAVDGREPVERLVALLNELIATIDVEGVVATDADVTVREDGAEATVWLAPLDPAAVVAPPKAATWHEARCEPAAGGGWHARVVIDR